MIQYNMRYRGPYEYEKLILNVYQYHNEMLDIEASVSSENTDNMNKTLEEMDTMSNQVKELSDKFCLLKEKKRLL